MQDNVGVVTEISVEGVVLQFGSVQVAACVFVNAVLSDNSFEIVESEEVRMVSAGHHKCSGCTGIWELVVTLEHQRGSKVGHFRVINLAINFLFGIAEVLLD